MADERLDAPSFIETSVIRVHIIAGSHLFTRPRPSLVESRPQVTRLSPQQHNAIRVQSLRLQRVDVP